MSWELKRGLEGMRRIVAQHKITGVYGTLIELLDVRHQLYSAVEVCISMRMPASQPVQCCCSPSNPSLCSSGSCG